MNDFQQWLEGKWQAESANISDRAIQDVLASMLLSLENEDDAFLDEFNQAIKDLDLAEADDKPSEYGVRGTTSMVSEFPGTLKKRLKYMPKMGATT